MVFDIITCLNQCKLQHRDPSVVSNPWIDHVAVAGTRDGITVEDNGTINFFVDTFKWPENDELRLDCNNGINISATF